jgi:hypothetical protein
MLGSTLVALAACAPPSPTPAGEPRTLASQPVAMEAPDDAGHAASSATAEASAIASASPPATSATAAPSSSGPVVPPPSVPANLPSLTVTAHSAHITTNVTIPSVFFDLPPCPAGTTRSDTRHAGYGEVACRTASTLEGPYASNTMVADGPLPGGVSERGAYRNGVRAGSWYRLTWRLGSNDYVERVYADGKVVSERRLVNHGPAADDCRKRCRDEEKSCEAQMRACPPGAPCLHRACDGERLSCGVGCDVVTVAPWQEHSKSPLVHPPTPGCDCAANPCVCSGMPALMRCASACRCPPCPAGIP